MKITEQLDGLRSQHPSCRIAAFADLSTGMVLAATSDVKTSQERLDALSANAKHALRGSLAQTVTGTMMNRSSDRTGYVMQICSSSVELFVEAPRDNDEALCLVCSSEADFDGLVSHARELLASIETALSS
jgi:hypothetical protein